MEILTPTGEHVSRLYLCGALTEISKPQKGHITIRIADPSGVFTVIVRHNHIESIEAIREKPLPLFVAVTAMVEPAGPDGSYHLLLEFIQIIERNTRDQWILRTVLCTIKRIEYLKEFLQGGEIPDDMKRILSHYATSTRQLTLFSDVCEKALSQVKPVAPPVIISEEEIPQIVLALIRDHSGPRGVSVEEITRLGNEKGLSGSQMMETIRSLISDDEIYQPSSGYIKIL